MTLAALTAALAFGLPFGGAGIEVVPYSDGHCGQTREAVPREAGGCVFDARPRTIWCNLRTESCEDVFLLAHELGHVLDFESLRPWHREAFARYYGREWHPEVFAEAYAACQTDTTANGSYYDARLVPWSAHGRRVCRALARWTRATQPRFRAWRYPWR